MSIAKESMAKLSIESDKVVNSDLASIKTVLFNEKRLFELHASRISGIRVVPIGIPKANVKVYNYSYSIGRLKVKPQSPLFEINNVSDDDRGSIYAVVYKGFELYNLNATNEAIWRGGHTHPYDVQFNMVVGKGRWLNFENGKWTQIVQSAGQKVIIKAGVLHCYQALEPSLMTELDAKGVSGEPFAATDDTKMRHLLKELNKAPRLDMKVSEFARIARA